MADMFAPLVAQLKANPKTIVFTEGNDPRILEAASKLLAEGVLKVVMVGNEAECKAAAAAGNFDISAAEIIDPENYATAPATPDSLDGVIFLDKRPPSWTPPHPMSWSRTPGRREQVVSLYHTLDADALHAHADEVKRLFAQNTALRSRAARYIASAGSLLLDSRRAEACSAN